MNRVLTTLVLALVGIRATAQEVPQEIPKKELPRKAICIVCAVNGEGHGEEKPAAGALYRGKTYYFCNIKELATFKQDPTAYLPPILPRPAPEKLGAKLTGGNTTLADYRGTVLLVDFWATWCAPCVKAMPEVQKLHDQFAKKGFVAIGISIDEEGAKKPKPPA